MRNNDVGFDKHIGGNLSAVCFKRNNHERRFYAWSDLVIRTVGDKRIDFVTMFPYDKNQAFDVISFFKEGEYEVGLVERYDNLVEASLIGAEYLTGKWKLEKAEVVFDKDDYTILEARFIPATGVDKETDYKEKYWDTLEEKLKNIKVNSEIQKQAKIFTDLADSLKEVRKQGLLFAEAMKDFYEKQGE